MPRGQQGKHTGFLPPPVEPLLPYSLHRVPAHLSSGQSPAKTAFQQLHWPSLPPLVTALEHSLVLRGFRRCFRRSAVQSRSYLVQPNRPSCTEASPTQHKPSTLAPRCHASVHARSSDQGSLNCLPATAVWGQLQGPAVARRKNP